MMNKTDYQQLLANVKELIHEGAEHNPRETKKSLLRLALLSVMKSGELKPGDRLPSELAMTKALELSAGTIQGALRQLQDLGVIIRRRGDGTVVADAEPIGDTVWHFRFVHKGSGRPLRPSPSIIDISEISEQGEWTRYLGPPPYIRITRSIRADGIQLGAIMYLPNHLLDVAHLQREEFDGVNLRVVLESELGERALRDRTVIRHIKMDYELAALFSMIPGSDVMDIRAYTRLSNGEPFYYQEIFAPADSLELEV